MEEKSLQPFLSDDDDGFVIHFAVTVNTERIEL